MADTHRRRGSLTALAKRGGKDKDLQRERPLKTTKQRRANDKQRLRREF